VLEENKRLVRRALEEVYNTGNLELADEFFHPSFVNHAPAHPDLPVGPDSVRQTLRGLHSTFGDLHFEIEAEIAEGDMVVQRVTMSGRHIGPLMGHEPTGREFGARQTHMWRVADGKIVEHWGTRDDLDMLQQLGLPPGPA
jgi:predicted ester cyclase